MGKMRQRIHRRCSAAVFLVAGLLIGGPAMATIFISGDTALGGHPLITTAASFAPNGPQPADSGLAARWRVAEDRIREVKLSDTKLADTVPFNLFGRADLIPDYEHLGEVAGAGTSPTIVPGDHGETILRISNHGSTSGVISVSLRNNYLQPTSDPTAYQHLLINGSPASELLKTSEAPLFFAHISDLAAMHDANGNLILEPGQQIDLPFSWSFFAEPTDPLTGRPHNIGNFADFAAEFQLHVELVERAYVIDPSDSTNPTDSANPTEPTDPVSPVDPTDPANLDDLANRDNPGNSASQAGANSPARPLTPDALSSGTNPRTNSANSDGKGTKLPTTGSGDLELLATGGENPELLITGGDPPTIAQWEELPLQPISLFLIILLLIASGRVISKRVTRAAD